MMLSQDQQAEVRRERIRFVDVRHDVVLYVGPKSNFVLKVSAAMRIAREAADCFRVARRATPADDARVEAIEELPDRCIVGCCRHVSHARSMSLARSVPALHR